MEPNENDFSPQDSLRLIDTMINRSKNRFAEDGQMYLVWGWLVFVCSITQFVLLHFYQSEYHYTVWIASWLVVIYQVIYMRKKRRNKTVRTYTDDIIAYIWITFAILIFLIGFVFGRLTNGEYYSHIFPLVLALYGMPIFLSGVIIRFRPLIFGGIGCWILSICTTFIKVYDFQILMVPVAMIIAWIIPGYLLRARFKEMNKRDV